MPRVETANALISEKELADTVIGMAYTFGWKIYRTWVSIHSPAGFPDLVMAREWDSGRGNGRLIFAELKSQRGKVSPEQQQWLDALALTVPGVEVYLWRPSDLDQIEDVLR